MSDVARERPAYKSKRCVNCKRATWPGRSVMGDPWTDTVFCSLLNGLAFVNHVCKEHVRMDAATTLPQPVE